MRNDDYWKDSNKHTAKFQGEYPEQDKEYIKDCYEVLKNEVDDMVKISAYNDDVIWEEVDTILECLKMIKRKMRIK